MTVERLMLTWANYAILFWTRNTERRGDGWCIGTAEKKLLKS